MDRRGRVHRVGGAAAVALVAMGLLASACGSEAGRRVTTSTAPPSSVTASPAGDAALEPSTSTPSAVTVTATSTTSTPPTTRAHPTTTTDTVPPPSTTTTQPPPATTTTEASPAASSPHLTPWTGGEGFPDALPPERIPWDDVGPDWLLVRYEQAYSGNWRAAPQALLLIGPDDSAYGVAGWPDGESVPPTTEILAWSPEGRRILVYDGGLEVIDLRDRSGIAVPVELPDGLAYPAAPSSVEARFTRPTGRDIVVRAIDPAGHVRLDCLRTDGSLFARLADFDFSPFSPVHPENVTLGVSWLFAPAGTEVVIATGEGIGLLTNQGAGIRTLDTPGLGCTLARWWDGGSVLAACYDADWVASACWDRGPTPGGRSLWSVPVDGTPATRLTPEPVCADDGTAFAGTYVDGLKVGGSVAAETSACCACGGSLDFIGGGTVTGWAGYAAWENPSGATSQPPLCSPHVVATRNERLLVLDRMWSGFGVIFEADPDGSTRRAVTPAETSLHGGVIQVMTTAEAAYRSP